MRGHPDRDAAVDVRGNNHYQEGAVFYHAIESAAGGKSPVEAKTGREHWRFDAGAGLWVAPAVTGGLVLFGARDGVFHAPDAQSGTPRWRFRTGHRIFTTAFV